MQLTLEHQVSTAVAVSERVGELAAMFGLGLDEQRTLTVVPRMQLTLKAGQVGLITGASGGGKSTLLRLIGKELRKRPREARVIDFQTLQASADGPLVEAIGGTLEQATSWLAMAGLGDAFVMLRRPGELSEGQHYRWRLAQAMALAETQGLGAGDQGLVSRVGRVREVRHESLVDGQSLVSGEDGGSAALDPPSGPPAPSSPPCHLVTPSPCHPLPVVLADEFGSTLDRLTASVVARQVRRWASRRGICFLAATAHDDLLEPLDPDLLIVQQPGEKAEVLERSQGVRR